MGLLLLAGAIALLMTHYRGVTVSGRAMEPTYSVGEQVYLRRIHPGEVRRGDVVLYQMPDRHQGAVVLRRVIGLGGDRVAARPGAQVTVNGKPLAEPYVKDGDPSAGSPPYDVVVPQGRLFLLGDNRALANDSRFSLSEQSGSVAAASVQARVLKDRTGLVVLALAALLGLLLTVIALVWGFATRGARQPRWRPPALPTSA
ncbi:signal peptidase I [Streptomyces afghaniensis]|uniref:signal peptidase I n=1 Tax=Streptomyces afghaniensis TaxID=66865 RepID=UPI0027D76E63|nr:signal peptidase I [Streptomyces afghaniensis]